MRKAVLILGTVILLLMAVGVAWAAPIATPDCPQQVSWLYATAPSVELAPLLEVINHLPLHVLAPEPIFWVEDIRQIEVVVLPDGRYQVIALLAVLDRRDVCGPPPGTGR